jgi:hypothetical protein
MITVFCGPIGSGKDYRANKLKDEGHVRIDFKDDLIDLCSDIVGFDIRPEYGFFKDMIVGWRKPSNPLVEAFMRGEVAEILRKHPETITGRKMLQRVGTEAMRKRDPNYWVHQFSLQASATLAKGVPGVVVADCRFANEVHAIKEFGQSRFVFCDYRSERYDPSTDHESERLAQALLRMDLKDGQEITPHHFECAFGMLA